MVSPAAAGETDTYGVAPHPPRVAGAERRTFAVPLEPGQVFADAVRVYNRTADPITLSLYGADASVGSDGIVAVGFRGSSPRGFGASVKLERNEVTLAPGEDDIVAFTVAVPGAATLDDLGAIVVENEPASAGALDVIQRVAVLVRPTAEGAPTGARRMDDDTGFSRWWAYVLGAAAIVGGLRGRAVLSRRRRHPMAEPVPEPHSATEEIDVLPLVAVAVGPDQAPADHISGRERLGSRPAEGARMPSVLLASPDTPDRRRPRPSPDSTPKPKRPRSPRKPRSVSSANRTGSTKPRQRKLNYIPLDDL